MPGPSIMAAAQKNVTSFTSIRASSTKAVSRTSVLPNSAQASSASAVVPPNGNGFSATTSPVAFRTSVLPSSAQASSTPAVVPPNVNGSSSTKSPVFPASGGFWNYRNSPFGTNIFVGTGIPPALVNHDDQLLVLYTDKSSNNLYYALGTNDGWGSPIEFIDASGQSYSVSNTQAPALASFYGDLHAVIQQNNDLIHFVFNHTAWNWNYQSVVSSASYSYPSLVTYNDKLFLAFVETSNANKIYFCFWAPEVGWSQINSANGESTWGIPAMYVQGDQLYLLFSEYNSNRGILNLVYDTAAASWSRSTSLAPESTAFGVSATSGDGMSFAGFQDHGGSGGIFVSVNDGSWAAHENTGGLSSDTPTMAVLDGVLNVIFDAHNDNRDVLWLQRPLISYSLESWMSVLSDDRYLSSLSIPGTHDSTAVSYAPTVGCQTMGVTAQLNAGIRYLDLRSGLWDNQLIMYHGSYPINPPFFLSLSSVLQSIQEWLSLHETETVIVQIKQDADRFNSTISFASAVNQLIQPNPSLWNLGTTIPTLGASRGKMQLMRRYSVNQTAGEAAIGIDVTNWPDNNPRFDIHTSSGAHLIVQDEYKFNAELEAIVPDKFVVFASLLNEAISDPDPTTWYINFSSATRQLFLPNPYDIWIMPEDIAVGGWDFTNSVFVLGVNTYLRQELYVLPSGKRYGTILMDYPESEDDLIARIVASN